MNSEGYSELSTQIRASLQRYPLSYKMLDFFVRDFALGYWERTDDGQSSGHVNFTSAHLGNPTHENNFHRVYRLCGC